MSKENKEKNIIYTKNIKQERISKKDLSKKSLFFSQYTDLRIGHVHKHHQRSNILMKFQGFQDYSASFFAVSSYS